MKGWVLHSRASLRVDHRRHLHCQKQGATRSSIRDSTHTSSTTALDGRKDRGLKTLWLDSALSISPAVACPLYDSDVRINQLKKKRATDESRDRTDGCHVAQDLGTIDPNPVEGRVWELVHIVPIDARQLSLTSYIYLHLPAELLGKEVLHTPSAEDLWERTGKAETIREPPNATPLAEARLEVALTVDELPCERLAGRHVSVVLDPRATDWIEFPLEHLLAHSLEERWVQLLEPLVLLSRGAHKAVLRITFHKINLCRP